jgi:F420-dependent oxidoreductase-like protein
VRLGYRLRWDDKQLRIDLARVREVERLGFDSVWSAEAYGSDALTPLAYIAGHTQHIRLGTCIAQLAARTPASTAMAIGTIDALAGQGRAILGLGVSGPQIVEGWYGQPWGKPAQRMRDYVAIVKQVLAREGPVTHDGPEISLPYSGPGSAGMGKPLKSILHCNPRIPVMLGVGAESTVKLCAEIADGWLTFGFRPGAMKTYRPWLEEGFRRAGGGKSFKDFEIWAGSSVRITSDVKAALAAQKPFIALYVGGMGHPKLNFHKKRMEREGWPEVAARIQELFLAGKREEAIAAVPDEYVDAAGLIGPKQRIRERWKAWRDSGATGLIIEAATSEELAFAAELAELRPRES